MMRWDALIIFVLAAMVTVVLVIMSPDGRSGLEKNSDKVRQTCGRHGGVAQLTSHFDQHIDFVCRDGYAGVAR